MRVVGQLGDAPVAGATVFYVALEDGESWDTHPAWDFDRCDAWLEEHGRSTTTGADGLARLDAAPRHACIVVATAVGRFGRARLAREADGSAASEVPHVVLAPDGEIRVLTLGPDGAPAEGAPVEVRSYETLTGKTKLRGASDERGVATFAHVLARPLPVTSSDVVAFGGLLDASFEVALDPRALPADPIVLRLPPTGGVEVRVRAGDDTNSFEPGSVNVSRAVGAEGELPSQLSRRSTVSARLVDGSAFVDWVEIGMELDVSVATSGATHPTTVRARGPVAAGEVVRVEVTLGADHPILRLRVVDATGAPIMDAKVRTTVLTQLLGVSSSDVVQPKTDAAGVLLIELPKGQRVSSAIQVRVERVHAGVELLGKVEAPGDLAPGIVELGDVVLREAPVLVAGRVVDERGAGVAGAEVRVRVGPSVEGRLPDDDDERRATFSGEDGSFVLRGEAGRAPLRISAKLDESTSDDVSCKAGATDVTIELRSSSSIRGRLLVDDDLSPDTLSVTLKPELDERTDVAPGTIQVSVGKDGVFRSEALRPGRYSLHVTGSQYGVNVLRLTGVDAPPGRPSPDPRLEAIDLRGRLITIDLELVPPKPTDRVTGMYFARRMDSNGEWGAPERNFLQVRTLRLHLVASQVDLSISAHGFRTVELTNVRGARRVVLERGPRVRLFLPPDVELPAPPHYLKAYLAEVGVTDPLLSVLQEQVFGPDRELTLYTHRAGKLEVRWLLERRLEKGLSTASLDLDPPQALEILDVAGEQVFEVIAPVEQLALHIRRQSK